jgi:hypothetical protein
MELTWLLLILLAVLAVGAVAAVFVSQRQRASALRGRFGPEYFHLVDQYKGDRRKAEAALLDREKRVKKFHIRPLSPEEHGHFAENWTVVQARFVDDPMAAVTDADRLVTSLMQQRGYPMADFETRAADLSVDHPKVVEHYRAARRIAGRNQEGQADTEELRRAFVHYRVLFGDLLETADTEHRVGMAPQA